MAVNISCLYYVNILFDLFVFILMICNDQAVKNVDFIEDWYNTLIVFKNNKHVCLRQTSLSTYSS